MGKLIIYDHLSGYALLDGLDRERSRSSSPGLEPGTDHPPAGFGWVKFRSAWPMPSGLQASFFGTGPTKVVRATLCVSTGMCARKLGCTGWSGMCVAKRDHEGVRACACSGLKDFVSRGRMLFFVSCSTVVIIR